ncbi:MAG: hypothetical protein GY953_48040, partial [bacterium]|nr:hypothetical protein [bacterium]
MEVLRGGIPPSKYLQHYSHPHYTEELMPAEQNQRWMLAILPAVAMSVGWGFRGFIGGGPLGAMIPGALVAMSLSLLVDRKQTGCSLAAAFGAV